LKKNKPAYKNYFYGSLLVFLLLSTSTPSAMEQYPYFDPQQGYGIENDANPWFDGKDYPFFQEMYDGKSLKPQEGRKLSGISTKFSSGKSRLRQRC